ncbi:PREDICTED: solute carrier family 22 member 11 [Chrysochloris asiatica]|uniref:Solute carrier family 22 member 11 n=1 Tax=Chrysochloris asiatica TaxID=185453 RepID=A0A9B0WNE4_CHRAS|nr:PREDICTED: solute carrier family 22 member 11 [Chrysochloris asiatica]
MAFTELLELVGSTGVFQTLQIFTLLLPSVLIPSQLLLENFSAAMPDHRCWTPLLDNSSEVPVNLSLKALLTVSIPPGPHQGPHQCLRFRHPQWQLLGPNATTTNWSKAATEPCVDGWVYDHSTFTSTIVSQWNLVCQYEHLKPLGQSIYMSGILLGSTLWGLLSDRFGRTPTLSWCCLQVAVTGTSTIFAPNFFVYCGLRFLSAFGVAGIIMTSTILMVEWTTTPRRMVAMTILGCSYSTGQIVMGGLAFALRDWRILQLSVSVPFFAFFLVSWWLPESARWLIIVGKPDKGLQELKKVARINGHKEAKKTLTIEVLMSNMQEELASAKTRQSMLDLFRLPLLRWRTLALFMVIFSITLSYYGLVLDLQNLGSDIFLLQVLFGAVDLVGRATTPLLLKFFGRRVTLASTSSLAGISILANVLVPQDLQTLRLVFAVLGKGCFGISLTCFMLYRTELFPTSLRMTADGVLQSAARLGAVMGPLIRMTRQALPLLPPLAYGIIPIVSNLFLLLLPETQGLPLPDTLHNLESQ